MLEAQNITMSYFLDLKIVSESSGYPSQGIKEISHIYQSKIALRRAAIIITPTNNNNIDKKSAEFTHLTVLTV